MSDDADLLGALHADLGAVIAGTEHDADVLRTWLGGRSAADIIAACTADLDPAEREEFLEASGDPAYRMLLVADVRHPHFAAIVAWVEARDDVLLLASPSGPRPPAVATIER